ncbi:MAG: hypothetical protein JW929_05025 [Anaerolineales bacterium]|nr:hypothetical protein [Anaerolineales bacterium]
MNRLFLDPHKPLSTCSAHDCQGCPVHGRLECHFGFRGLVRFFVFALPLFILGGIGIARINGWLLLPWIGVCLVYFLLVEIRVMCSHCPHYAEPGTRTLQCWANYGAPKLWKYRPGRMSRAETAVFFSGLVPIAGYPAVVLIAGSQWLLLALFAASAAGLGTLMRRIMCSHCINFACPLNLVERPVRELFFARNPRFARAWGWKGTK